MRGRKGKPSVAELNELAKQFCGEESDESGAWMRLDPRDFEPFFRAGDVCLWESPVVSAAAAPSWMRSAADELAAKAGGAATHFLLYIESSEHTLSLELVSDVVKEAQSAIDMGSASFIVGYRTLESLKEGEATLLVLASVEPEPRPGT